MKSSAQTLSVALLMAFAAIGCKCKPAADAVVSATAAAVAPPVAPAAHAAIETAVGAAWTA